MRPGPGRDQWDCTSEDTKQGHVALDEGHVHESPFYESDKFFVYTQADICWSENNRLSIFYLCLSDRDVLIQCNSSVPSEQSIHSNNFLTLIFRIGWPGNRHGCSLAVNLNKIAGGNVQLLHRLIVDSNLSMAHVALLGVCYSCLNFLATIFTVHHSSIDFSDREKSTDERVS